MRNTKPLAAVGFSRVTLQGIFLNFQEHLLCIQHTCFLILLSEHKSGQTRQAANNLLLAREHSPVVNNKTISISCLEQSYPWNITIFNLKVES